MKPRAFLKLLCLLPLVAVLAGCVTHRAKKEIEVSLANIQPGGTATLLETAMAFTIRVQNGLNEDVLLEGSEHKIYLNGTYVGKGLANEPVRVPKLGSSTQVATVYLRNLKLVTRIKPIIESKHMDYRLKSVLYLRINNRPVRMETSQEGALNLSDFQPTPGGQPAAK